MQVFPISTAKILLFPFHIFVVCDRSIVIFIILVKNDVLLSLPPPPPPCPAPSLYHLFCFQHLRHVFFLVLFSCMTDLYFDTDFCAFCKPYIFFCLFVCFIVHSFAQKARGFKIASQFYFFFGGVVRFLACTSCKESKRGYVTVCICRLLM